MRPAHALSGARSSGAALHHRPSRNATVPARRRGPARTALAAAAVWAVLPAGAAGQAGPATDRAALEALHAATDGANWTDGADWLTDAPLGAWYGVTTDGAGRVTRLDLDDNGLAGPIPDALGDLTHLEWLDLRENALTGPIPDALGNLAKLELLDLGVNGLTGPIPERFGRLANLAAVSVWDNDLTGPIPDALGSLTELETLFLGANGLTGPIPDALGNLTKLKGLSLSRNGLTGPIPDALGSLTNLEALYLYGNHLTGPVPSWLGSLTNLELLYLYDNDLTGPIPEALGRPANLERLRLDGNWGLSGPLPPGLRSSRSLFLLNVFLTQACAPAAWRDWLETISFTGRRCGDEAVTIDVAVVHTPAARAAAPGGTAAIAAFVDLLIAETNQAWAASGVRHRAALVGLSEVQYTETGDSEVDLDRLADPSDGHMDAAHALRDQVGADLVHLIVDADKADVGGIARLGGAFSLTTHLGDGRTFAHELGHNLGLQHDRYQIRHHEGGVRAHPGYGYVNQRALATEGVAPSRRWRTVMSYGTQCDDAGVYCSQLPRFSNPRQRHEGDPLGVPWVAGAGDTGGAGPADAAAVLDATAPAVALWRDRGARSNRSPAAVGVLPDVALTPGAAAAVDVSRAFADPDGDTLSYAVSSAAPEVVTVAAAGPRMTVTAVGAGAAAVRVTATDPGGLSAAQSFTATVGSNRPPAAVGVLPDVALTPGVATAVDMSRAFADPDGDTLRYAVSSSAPEVVTAAAAGSRVTVTAVGAGAAAVRVTATDPGGLGAAQSFTATVVDRPPGSFADHPIQPGTTRVRAVHFAELRARIDGLRQAAGLEPFPWTDPVLTAGVTPVRLVHLVELRTALAAAYAAAGRPAPGWTDAAPAAGATPVRAAHLMELRAAVTALE